MNCEKCKALSALIDGYRRERDEARAEVERLRLDIATSNESFTAGYKDGVRDAYRRGAEAMREACARVVDAADVDPRPCVRCAGEVA